MCFRQKLISWGLRLQVENEACLAHILVGAAPAWECDLFRLKVTQRDSGESVARGQAFGKNRSDIRESPRGVWPRERGNCNLSEEQFPETHVMTGKLRWRTLPGPEVSEQHGSPYLSPGRCQAAQAGGIGGSWPSRGCATLTAHPGGCRRFLTNSCRDPELPLSFLLVWAALLF